MKRPSLDPTSLQGNYGCLEVPMWVTCWAYRQGKMIPEMAFMDDKFERAMDAMGTMGRTALAPWGGAEACVDAYEGAIRAATDAQLNVARAIPIEPFRSLIASCAHLTRDVGATH